MVQKVSRWGQQAKFTNEKNGRKSRLGPNVKNHSGRKTMIQTLTNNNIPATDIIQLLGHKNLQSVTNYSVVSEKQQVKMSRTLSQLMSENVHTLENQNEFISSWRMLHWNSFSKLGGRTSSTSNKRCRLSRAPLFMEVNSAFPLTVSINSRSWKSKKLWWSLLQRGTEG